ncbi:MAG: proton-conducting transporter membrane subunit [Rickettsiaceae bacterium]
MFIAKHFPALQVLIPFLGALLSALSFNRFAAWAISTLSAIATLIISIQAYSYISESVSYSFGGWQAPVGIEYRIDILNQPIIIFINAILAFFLVFGKELINLTVTKYIEDNRQHIFYSLLLFAHSGYLGVVSTNDLFNIYVFIEISSLATYVLMSKGKTPSALVGAFDYLVMGTIGATLILIGIGFLLALTGSLNITDVASILSKQGTSRVATTAIVFFLSGAILKMAFFPMHFWMIRSYSSAAPFILTYLASISSILGVYIILRFLHFTIDGDNIQAALTFILRPVAMATIFICTLLALRARDLKQVMIYSTASQIGYIFLLITILPARRLLFQLLIMDAINKIALFTIITHIQIKAKSLNFKNFAAIEGGVLFKTLVAFSLIFSAGLPMTSMFVVKVKMLDLLISKDLITAFIITLLGSVFGLLYHLRLTKALFFGTKDNGVIKIEAKLYGLVAIVVFQILTMVYINDLTTLAGYSESILY